MKERKREREKERKREREKERKREREKERKKESFMKIKCGRKIVFEQMLWHYLTIVMTTQGNNREEACSNFLK